MPSTEFLLYLVTVIFVVYVIMTHVYKDTSSGQNYDSKRIDEYHSDMSNSRPKSPNKYQRSNSNYASGDGMTSQSRQYQPSQQSGNYQPSHQSGNYQPSQLATRHNLSKSRHPRYDDSVDRPVRININNENDPHQPFPPYPPVDPLREFDYAVKNDDLTPPYRRSYYDEYHLVPGLFPHSTRGPHGTFRKVGTLVAEGVSSNDKYKFLNLMGRKKYMGSGDFEYFASSLQIDAPVKFMIETRGKEISEGDIVKIPELEGYSYKFNEHKDMSALYHPYIL